MDLTLTTRDQCCLSQPKFGFWCLLMFKRRLHKYYSTCRELEDVGLFSRALANRITCKPKILGIGRSYPLNRPTDPQETHAARGHTPEADTYQVQENNNKKEKESMWRQEDTSLWGQWEAPKEPTHSLQESNKNKEINKKSTSTPLLLPDRRSTGWHKKVKC